MKKKRFTEEQIVRILRDAEAGTFEKPAAAVREAVDEALRPYKARVHTIT